LMYSRNTLKIASSFSGLLVNQCIDFFFEIT
jgi:hypothetical protein